MADKLTLRDPSSRLGMNTSPSTTGVRTQRNPPQLAGMTLRDLDADVAEPVITARAQLRSSPRAAYSRDPVG
jgi:hypothetical protein